MLPQDGNTHRELSGLWVTKGPSTEQWPMASVPPLHQSTSGQSCARPLQLRNHPTGSRPSHLPPGPFISLLSLPRSQTQNSTQQSKKSLKLKAYHTANSCTPPPNSFTGFQLIQGQISSPPQSLYQYGPCLPQVDSDYPLPHYTPTQ